MVSSPHFLPPIPVLVAGATSSYLLHRFPQQKLAHPAGFPGELVGRPEVIAARTPERAPCTVFRQASLGAQPDRPYPAGIADVRSA